MNQRLNLSERNCVSLCERYSFATERNFRIDSDPYELRDSGSSTDSFFSKNKNGIGYMQKANRTLLTYFETNFSGDPFMKCKIACIFNYAPHYRSAIYSMMDKELGCNFYFGANLRKGQDIKKMDVSILKGFKHESKVHFLRYRWQCGYPWLSLHKYTDFILTGDASLSNLLLVFLCKIFKKRVFLWCHGVKSKSEKRSSLLRLLYTNVSGFFLYGDFGKTMMMDFGIPEDKLFVIYNSLDYDAQLKVRQVLDHREIYSGFFHNSLPVVLFSGRLMPGKQLQMIIEAQGIANEKGQPFNIVFIGDGPEREKLEVMSKTVANGALTWFFGKCFHESKLGELFFNADVCVSPGNVGLTAIHSLTYGTPIVTHSDMHLQMPEAEAIDNGVSGGFFERGEVGDMWEKMKIWFNKSAEERAQIRQSCYQIIDTKFNPHYQLNIIKQALCIKG